MIAPRNAALLPLLAATLAFWTGALPPLHTRAQDGDDEARAAALLDRHLAGAEARSLEETWAAVEDLVGAPSIDAAALARVLDAALEETTEPGPRLLLCAARLRVPAPDPTVLGGALLELLSDPDERAALGAARLLAVHDDAGRPEFVGVDRELRNALVAALDSGARDAARSPELRLACAVALRELAPDGKTRRRARKEMLSFLDSADVRLRALGALALAQAGDIDSGRPELERLAALPGAEGRLAGAYLKQDDLRRLGDRRIQNERDQYESRRASEESGEFPQLDRMEQILDLIRSTHLVGDQRSREELIEAALDGMLRRLDPYGGYMTGDEYAAWLEEPTGAESTRIGAQVRIDPYDGLLTIVRVLPGGPAHDAGFLEGDKIVRIGSWPTPGRPIHEAIRRLRGRTGEEVDVYVWRRGMDPGLIDRPTADRAIPLVLEDPSPSSTRLAILPEGIGLIEIVEFAPGTDQEVRSALSYFSSEGVSAVALDLRAAAGELLDEAAEVADLFLPAGRTVVTTRSRVQDAQELYSEGDPTLAEDVPLVVLVDRFSTSSAEIVAGALQDHDRARVYGERTVGSGSARVAIRVPGETDDLFEDENGNGRYDSWEKLTRDWNENGRFDYAPRVRLAVTALVRPSGRPIHRQLDETGEEVVEEGGIHPDVEAITRAPEAWQAEEIQRLREAGSVRMFAEELFESNREEAVALAGADGESTDRYPGYDALYSELRTPLSQDLVLELVRWELRRLMAVHYRPTRPRGDFQTDLPLQEAIAGLLEAQGRSYEDVPAFADTFDIGEDTAAASALVADALPRVGRDSVADAVRAIEQAMRGDRRLSPEELDRLQEILAAALEQP